MGKEKPGLKIDASDKKQGSAPPEKPGGAQYLKLG